MGRGDNADTIGNQYILLTDSESEPCYDTDLGKMCKAYDSKLERGTRYVMLLRLNDWCAHLPTETLESLNQQVNELQRLTEIWQAQGRRLQGVVKCRLPSADPAAESQGSLDGPAARPVYFVALTWVTPISAPLDLFKLHLKTAQDAVTFVRSLSEQLDSLCRSDISVRPQILIDKLALEPHKSLLPDLVLGDLGLDNVLDQPQRSAFDQEEEVKSLVELLVQLLDGIGWYAQGTMPPDVSLTGLRTDPGAVQTAWPWRSEAGAYPGQEDLWTVLANSKSSKSSKSSEIKTFSELARRLADCYCPTLATPVPSPAPSPVPLLVPPPSQPAGPGGRAATAGATAEKRDQLLIRIMDNGEEHVFAQPLVRDGIVLLGSQGFTYVSYPAPRLQQGLESEAQKQARARQRADIAANTAAELAQRRIYVHHHDNKKTRTEYYTITDYDPPHGAPRLLLDDQPLSPLFSALLVNRSVLNLGGRRMNLDSKIGGDPSGWIVPLMAALDPFERGRMPLELAMPGGRLVVEPYLAATALPLILRNLTQRLDGLSIFVETPVGWPTAHMMTVPLDGRQSSETQYPLRVPQQLEAGEYPLVVRLISDNIGAQVAAIGVRLVIPPLYSFSAVMEPETVRTGSVGALHLSNTSNVGRQLLVSWRDRGNEVRFDPAETIVALPAFSAGVINYHATVRRRFLRWLGSERRHELLVTVAPESPAQGAPQVLAGQVVSGSKWAPWLRALALLALVAFLAQYILLYPPRFENHVVVAGDVAGGAPVEGQSIELRWQDRNSCIYTVERNGEAIAAPQWIGLDPIGGEQRTFQIKNPAAGDRLSVQLRGCSLVSTDEWTVEVLPVPTALPQAPTLGTLADFALRTQNVVTSGFGTGGAVSAVPPENQQVLLAGQTGDLCIRWDVAESFAGERYGLRLVTEPRVEAIEQQAAIDQLVGERCFPIAETFTDVIADPDKPNLYYIRMGTVERATGNLVNVSTETKVVQLFAPACWVRTNEAVWMREGPGMEFAERGRMAPRDRVFPQSSPLRLRDLNQADIWWTPVIVANDPRVGWIQASNLDCPVPIDVLPANGQIPATPTPTPTPSPTATPLPTVTPTPVPEPSFSVDPRIIEQGECAMLKWSIQNVERVYLDGEGVVGEGERRVCPPDEGVVVYTWLIVNKDGTQMQRSVTLDVNED